MNEVEKTNSVRPIELKNVVDPRLDCLEFSQKQMEWGVFKGCEGQNVVQQQANSYSTSGIAWNFNTQSENVIIDRRIYARCQFLVTFVGRAPLGQKLLNSESDSPRCLPLASITNSLKVTINGSSVETQYADALNGLLRYNLSDHCKETDLSMSPSAQDKYQRYVDGVGSVRNPLSNYQNSGKHEGRGCFSYDALTNPVSADPAVDITASVLFTVTEPLLISPMKYKSSELASGFIGVQNMGVQFNFSAGQLARVWSRSPSAGVSISSVVCALGAGTTAPPSLLVNYLTPPLLSQSQIPKQVNYQYYKCETYVNDMNATLLPNASQTFTNNAIQLSTVPKCIYIWASRPNNTKTHLTSDTFFRINSLSLNYLNVSGQFSSMSIQDLYQMCVKNGCELSWTEWSGRAVTIGNTPNTAGGSIDGMVGSCIKLDISDLHIPSNVASGMNVNSQLSFSINVENINQIDTIGVQISTILVYDGLMTISNNSMATQIGVISERDVVETRKDRDNYVDYKSAQSIFGGDLFGKLGHFASMGKRGLDAVCGIKDAMGMGEHGGKCASGSKEVKAFCAPSHIKPKGKAKKGGQLLSRGELKARMFDY